MEIRLPITFTLLLSNAFKAYSSCPKEKAQKTGQIESELNEKGFYLNNKNYIWKICTLTGHFFFFEFDRFDLEKKWGPKCDDFLKITDNNKKKILFHRCGFQHNPQLQSDSNEITIEFQTDNFQSNTTGFKLRWYSIERRQSTKKTTEDRKRHTIGANKPHTKEVSTSFISTFQREKLPKNHRSLNHTFTSVAVRIAINIVKRTVPTVQRGLANSSSRWRTPVSTLPTLYIQARTSTPQKINENGMDLSSTKTSYTTLEVLNIGKDHPVNGHDLGTFLQESTTYIMFFIAFIVTLCGFTCIYRKLRHIKLTMENIRASQNGMNEALGDIKLICSGAYMQLDFNRQETSYDSRKANASTIYNYVDV